jgi:hypothetical protein
MASVNIPTNLTIALPTLTQAIERHLSGQEVDGSVEVREDPKNQRVVYRFGQTLFSFKLEEWRALGRSAMYKKQRRIIDGEEVIEVVERSAQQRGHLFRLSSKTALQMFDLAYTDRVHHELMPAYWDVFKDGRFALTRLDPKTNKPTLPRRLAKRNGVDPDSEQVGAFGFVIKYLTSLHVSTMVDGKEHQHGRYLTTPQTMHLNSSQVDGGEHRGGTWLIGQLNPELFAMSFSRFTQVDRRAFTELRPSDFLLHVAAKTQLACRSKNGGVIKLDTKRLARDSGNLMTTSSGFSKVTKRLGKSLQRMMAAGLLISALSAGGGKISLELPESLPGYDLEPSEFAVRGRSSPQTLPRQNSQLVEKQEKIAQKNHLVQSLGGCTSTAHPPLLTQEDGLKRESRANAPPSPTDLGQG